MARQSIRHQVRDPWWWGRSFIWFLTVALINQAVGDKNLWFGFGSLVFGLLAGSVLALVKGGWLKDLPELMRALRKPNAS